MTTTGQADQLVERALSLVGHQDPGAAASELARHAEQRRDALEAARDQLVGRIQTRSDDFEASSALSIVNAALARIGAPDGLAWEPKRWKLPRRSFSKPARGSAQK